MNGSKADKIEAAVDASAAGLLAVVITFVLAKLTAIGFAGAGAIIAFAGCFRILRSIAPEAPRFSLAPFDPAPFDLGSAPGLVLTDADRLERALGVDEGELVLDDVLAQIGAGARVVRLFDPAAMPTQWQAQARTDRPCHLGSSETAPPDASQALYAALAELRRSLR
jgi:hypothetical protein